MSPWNVPCAGLPYFRSSRRLKLTERVCMSAWKSKSSAKSSAQVILRGLPSPIRPSTVVANPGLAIASSSTLGFRRPAPLRLPPRGML